MKNQSINQIRRAIQKAAGNDYKEITLENGDLRYESQGFYFNFKFVGEFGGEPGSGTAFSAKYSFTDKGKIEK